MLGQRLDHARMAVAHGCHIVVHVEVFLAVGIPQMRPDAFHQMHRIAIEQAVSRSEYVAFLGELARCRIECVRHLRTEAVGVHDG